MPIKTVHGTKVKKCKRIIQCKVSSKCVPQIVVLYRRQKEYSVSWAFCAEYLAPPIFSYTNTNLLHIMFCALLFFFFRTVLLDIVHTTIYSFKVYAQRFFVYSQISVSITKADFRTFSSSKKETRYLLAITYLSVNISPCPCLHNHWSTFYLSIYFSGLDTWYGIL